MRKKEGRKRLKSIRERKLRKKERRKRLKCIREEIEEKRGEKEVKEY